MKKKKVKRLGIAGAVVLVVILVVFFGIMIIIDTAAKAVIERGGTFATRVDTSVQKADVGLFGGRFDMTGLRIGNPEGYETPHFLEMGDAGVSLDGGSLFSDTIEVPELKIDGIDLYLDKTKGPGNFNEIIENLKRFESGETPEGEPAEEAGGPQVVIKLVEIRNVTVHVAGIPGIQQLAGDVAVTVDKIVLTDVGKDGGVSVPQLIGVLIKAVISATLNAGAGILPDDLVGELGEGLGQLASLAESGIGEVIDVGGQAAEAIGEAAEEVGEGLQDAAEGVGDAAGDVVEGIGNIFGGDDDDDGG